MWKAWNWLILFCAACNAIMVGAAWYGGLPAWWFVWVSAIWFSVDIGLRCVADLLRAA